MDILNADGKPARHGEAIKKHLEEEEAKARELRKLIDEKPKVPKEIQKLTNALSNRRTPFFLIYVEDGQVKTIGKIETKDKAQTPLFLKQIIDNHYENL